VGTQGAQGSPGSAGAQGAQGAGGPSSTLNASAVTTNSTFFPVFVAGTGNQTPSIRTSSTAFSFNASSGNLTVGGQITSGGGTINFPTFNGNFTNRAYATWHQASDNLFVSVEMHGPYMNDFYVYAGPSTSTYYQIGRYGDDINANTKWTTITFFIRKDYWFWANTESTGVYRSWALT